MPRAERVERRWSRVLALLVAGACALTHPGAASALAGGRAYELVSTAQKQGGVWAPGIPGGYFALSSMFASTGGDHVMFDLLGGPGATGGMFNTFEASRTADGWIDTLVSPPPTASHPSYLASEGADFEDVSGGDFSRPIFTVIPGGLTPGTSGDGGDVYERNPDGTFAWVSHGSLGGVPASIDTPSYLGSSADGSHLLFGTSAALEPEVVGQLQNFAPEIYDRSGGATHVVGVLPDRSIPSGGADLGDSANLGLISLQGPHSFASYAEVPGVANAISRDGSRIFFTSPSYVSFAPHQVYVREHDATTIEISASQCSLSTCASGGSSDFVGASSDGSKAFLTSTAQLTNDPTGGNVQLYEYDVPAQDGVTGHLSCISCALAGGGILGTPPAGSIVGNSADGSRVYFVSAGALGSQGSAGNPNLYLYDGTLHFIATLASTDAVAPMAAELPAQARVTPDGRYLVFASAAQLTSYRTAGHTEVYRYDAGSGQLVCVSCSPDLPASTGDALLTGLSTLFSGDFGSVFSPPRNLSDDGSYVFFETAQELVPQDVNGEANVYEWHDGRLSLISDGTGPAGAEFVDASADGSNVFFTTYDQLVPQDTNDFLDLYDARIGGGFPAPGQAPAPCSGEDCQGPIRGAPALAYPSSATFFGPGDVLSPSRPQRGPRFAVIPIRAAARARLAQTGELRLPIEIGDGGRVTVSAYSAFGGRARVRVAHAAQSFIHGGIVHVTLRLSRAARARLAQEGTLVIHVVVSYSRFPRPLEATLRLTRSVRSSGAGR